jgi:hypothetical protein
MSKRLIFLPSIYPETDINIKELVPKMALTVNIGN